MKFSDLMGHGAEPATDDETPLRDDEQTSRAGAETLESVVATIVDGTAPGAPPAPPAPPAVASDAPVEAVVADAIPPAPPAPVHTAAAVFGRASRDAEPVAVAAAPLDLAPFCDDLLPRKR